MSKNLDSLDKLSEFPPLSPEEDDSGVNFIFNFFKFGNRNAGEASKSRETTPVVETAPPIPEPQPERKEQKDDSPDSVAVSSGSSLSLLYDDIGVGRSLPNVLKRISNLVALKNTGLQSYKDSNFKQYWMPDSVSKECYDCGDKFTTFRRRHHCRVCGQIFCSRCCREEISGKILGCTGNLKVCSYCGKVVLKYLQSADIGAELTADLRALQEDLQHKFGEPDEGPSLSLPQRSLSPGEKRSRRKYSYQEDRFALGRGGSVSLSSQFLTSDDLLQSDDLFRSPLQNALQGGSLNSLLEEMRNSENGLMVQTHRVRLKSHPFCFMGTQLVDWLLAHNKSSTMAEAIGVGQALLEGGNIECVSQPSDVAFHDGNALYRLSRESAESPFRTRSDSMRDIDRISTQQDLDSLSIPSTSSTYYLDLDVSESKVQLRRPRMDNLKKEEYSTSGSDGNSTCISKEFLKDTLFVESSSNRELVPSMGWHKAQHLRTDNGERDAYHLLSEAFEKYEEALLKQLLQTEGLSESWVFSIKPLVHQIVDLVRPDVKNEDDFMDIRQYVWFKKVPGGSRSECKMISGSVFTKHVAHRAMPTKFTNPKILILCCSISYARVEGKYVSLEPLILQEKDYLKNVVLRIVALKPDVVLVENTVSRLAQEMLLAHKITLVLNVKTVVLERLARLTQADKVKSIDAIVGKPTLGMCHNFSVQRFHLDNGQNKFLMFFDGCATHLGCSVLLRGGSASELKKIKRAMQHLILVNYSWRREKSFLMDEFAMPPRMPALNKKEIESSKEANLSIASEGSMDISDDTAPQDDSFIDPLQAPLESPESPESDPLQQYLKAATSFDEDILCTSIISVNVPAESSKFKDVLDNTVLSSSPMVRYKVPYLETEEGARSRLRRFFPEHVFWSALLFPSENNCDPIDEVDCSTSETPCYVRGPHAFVTAKLTQPSDSVETQTLLASYRAIGRRMRHPNEPVESIETTKKQKVEPQMKEELHPSRVQVDALSPYNHQKLAVLFCSFSSESNNAPSFCVNPWVVHMELYGKHDIPLGQFLEEYCFRKTYKCPSETCNTPMLRHIRRFVHDGSCVQVTLKQLESQIPVEGNSILTWSWCVVCKQVSPVVPLSVDTWALSLAKYLELKFHSLLFTRRGKEATCKHSLHQQHHQYFGYKDIIASFKYTKVPTWQISLPPPVIQIPFKASEEIQSAAIEEVKQLALKGYEVFSSVVEKLCDIGIEADPAKKEDLSKLKAQLNKDNSSFKTKIEEIQLKLTSPRLDESSKTEFSTRERLWDIEDSLIYMKRMIADAVTTWNTRLADVSKKKDEKVKKSILESSKVPVEGEQTRETPSPHPNQSFEGEASEENVSSSDTHLQLSTTDAIRAESTPLQNQQHSGSEDLWTNSVENIKKISSLDVETTLDKRRLSYSVDTEHADLDVSPSEEAALSFPEETDTSESQVNKGHERSHSEGDSRYPVSSVVDGPSIKVEKKTSAQNQTTVKQIISQLMTSNTNAFQIHSPLGIFEHHLLPLPLGPPVVVNTNEPSSIIAYALSAYDYRIKLAEQRGSILDVPVASELVMSGESVSSTKRTMLSFLRGGTSPNLNANRASKSSDCEQTQAPPVTEESVQEEKPRTSSVLSTTGQESTIDVQFTDGATTFHCRVFLADQFSRLRELVCPDGEDSFVRSLASCVHWAARGGKSGSTFCKTKDDRFVLKEMSQNEAQLFLEVAPHYLSYLRRCLESGQPTLLGKIVGAFRVSHRSLNSSASNKTHLLIMENLFYGRSVAQRFDLKGSLRNRLVDTSGSNAQGEEIVLLDENLIRMSCEAPLYILPHCKLVLTLAIERDTQFLASQGVMDYSLLVGLDEQSKELVVGIIDYVRLFTWDKKIETMVKSSGILGGQGKMPTIVDPEVYRARFMVAMHSYFLPVPDRWTGLGLGVAET